MEVLQLEIDGVIIPLPAGQVLTFVEETAAFSTDYQGGDYSLNFNIPVTPITNQIFGYSALPESVTPKKVRKAARILVSGGVWKEGLLTVQRGGNRYKAFYQSGISSALVDVLERPLNTLVFPDYSFADARAHALTVAQNAFSYDYCFFPVHAEEYSSNDLWNGVVNQFDVTTGQFVQNSVYATSGEYEFETVLTPFPRLVRVYELIFEALGLTLEAPIFEVEMVRRICLLSSNSLSEEVSVSTNFRIDGKTDFNLAEFLPDKSVGDFLIETNNALGCSLVHDKSTDTYKLKRRTSDILGESKIYEFKGKLISIEPILDQKKDFYFKFKSGEETFAPFDKEVLVDPDIEVPSMTFTSNQNAYRYGPVLTASFIPSFDMKMRSLALDAGSDSDNAFIWAVYDGITGASVSIQQRPYAYPQAHGRKFSDLLNRFDHFYGTLEWEGVSDFNDPTAPKAQNGLYYFGWKEWTEFERSATQVELYVHPTAEDIINSSEYMIGRIENYTVLIKEKETQINENQKLIKVTGYLL